MSSLRWSPKALSDVQRLYRFLVTKNPDAAKRAVQAIRSSVAILSHQPQAGKPIEETEADYREWIIEFGRDRYVVLYHYDGHEAVVLAVRHGREVGYF